MIPQAMKHFGVRKLTTVVEAGSKGGTARVTPKPYYKCVTAPLEFAILHRALLVLGGWRIPNTKGGAAAAAAGALGVASKGLEAQLAQSHRARVASAQVAERAPGS